MTHQVLTINHRRCHFLCAEQPPLCVVVKPLCAFERLRLEDEFALSVRLAPKAFAMVAFEVERAEFSHAGFPILLQYIDNALLAAINAHYGDLPLIVGGYSLGGLFALWCATQRPYFKAVAACSPSLWAEGWQTYYEQHPTKAEFVYMSMGKEEERTQKMPYKTVGDKCRWQHSKHLEHPGESHCELRWHDGDHFTQSERRKAQAFARCIAALSSTTALQSYRAK